MRQIHGIWYERNVILRFKLNCNNIKYTSKYYAYTQKDIPVQIKCIKLGSSIDLSDFKRNQTHKHNFIMIIGFWEDSKTNIVQEHILFFNKYKFNNLCSFDYTEQMLKDMKAISNDKKDDFTWKLFVKKYKSLYNDENLIKLRFKRDHKNQKRIQCAINNKIFYKKFIHSSFKHVQTL